MIITEIQRQINQEIIPQWEQTGGETLTNKLKQVVRVLTVVAIESHLPPERKRRGPKGHDRGLLARAFLVKALYNLPTTRHLWEMLHTNALLRRIVGWNQRQDIPSEPTFSRAFQAFAQQGLGDRVHEHLVQIHLQGRLVGHLGRDSSEIEAREKAAKKPKKEPKPKRKRGRPKKGEVPPPPDPTRLEKQMGQTPEEAFSELPVVCDVGCKKDSKGHLHCWKGYKIHLDTADGGLPLLAKTTSASLHDSQVAIPMMRTSALRVTSLYDLMDSAYDAEAIYTVSEQLGHKPIIDKNGRGKEVVPMDAATARRYCQRSVCERVNARLKDEFGGRQVRVRGHEKVHLHLMFGILALFADQLFQILKWA
jgi:transposase